MLYTEKSVLHYYVRFSQIRSHIPTGPTQPDVGLFVIAINCHSTLGKLLTVTTYVYRFVKNLRTSPEQQQTGPVSADELASARLQGIRDTRQTVYGTEIANLKQKATQPKTNRNMLVRQLRLFLDAKGHLRCGKRIHNVPLSEATRFPYLLPSKHPLSSLIVIYIHITLCHSGTGATLTALRQSYWIPAAWQFVKSLLRNCVIRRKVSVNPYPAPVPAYQQYGHKMLIRSLTQGWTSVEHCMYGMEGKRSRSICVYLLVPQLVRFIYRSSGT